MLSVTFAIAVLLACQIGNSQALQCYECQSNMNDFCGDPFDYNHNRLTNCSEKYIGYDHDVQFCRKTIEYLFEDRAPRVIRGCGWPKDIERQDRCIMRISNEIRVNYCTCTDSSCNTSMIANVSLFAIPITLLAKVLIQKLMFIR